MNKLIIQNNSDLSDLECLDFVREVVKLGRISNDNKQYCYIYRVEFGNKIYQIDSFLNKKSDRLVITKIRL